MRAEGKVNDTDARLWHPWLRINRVRRVMLHTRWSAEAWSQVEAEFTKALALRSQIGARAGSIRLVTAPSSCGVVLVRVVAAW
jgi:hypothetical protein